jgi:hypothetical protein
VRRKNRGFGAILGFQEEQGGLLASDMLHS